MKYRIKKNRSDREGIFPSRQYNVHPERLNPGKKMCAEYFAGFALSHILISVAGFAIGLSVGSGLASLPGSGPLIVTAVVGDTVLLGLYGFAGAWTARKKKWSLLRADWGAFLAPALIAWAWGALVVASVHREVWPLLMAELWGSLVFAFPSSLMVYLAFAFYQFDGNFFAGLGLRAFLAGGIPPLLFFLGSLWGSRRPRKGSVC